MRSVLQIIPLLAGLSQAFLIPPAISEAATEAISSFSPLAQKLGFDPFKQRVELSYSGPFYEGKYDGLKIYSNIKNVLAFDIQGNPEQPYSLAINGHEVFKINRKSLEPLTAVQLPKEETKLTLATSAKVNLNYEIFINTIARGVKSIRFHVLSVDGIKTPRDMDILEITVFSDHHGIVYIGKAESRHPTPSEASAAECKQRLLCRWKAYFADRITSLKHSGDHRKPGCHGKRPSHSVQSKHDDVKAIPHRPHHHDDGKAVPHRPHHHHDINNHKHMHHNLHYIRRAAVVALFSIILGIVLGTMVMFVTFFLGMIAGKIYAVITGKEAPYMKYMGCRGCRMTEVFLVDDEEHGLLGDEKMLVVEMETEELPAYTDSEGVIRGDEKSEL